MGFGRTQKKKLYKAVYLTKIIISLFRSIILGASFTIYTHTNKAVTDSETVFYFICCYCFFEGHKNISIFDLN